MRDGQAGPDDWGNACWGKGCGRELMWCRFVISVLESPILGAIYKLVTVPSFRLSPRKESRESNNWVENPTLSCTRASDHIPDRVMLWPHACHLLPGPRILSISPEKPLIIMPPQPEQGRHGPGIRAMCIYPIDWLSTSQRRAPSP
jgi:hypothetical protein